jgi:hypothetical protein
MGGESMTDFPDERELSWLIEDHNLFACDGFGCSNDRCVWCTDIVEKILEEKGSDEADDI